MMKGRKTPFRWVTQHDFESDAVFRITNRYGIELAQTDTEVYARLIVGALTLVARAPWWLRILFRLTAEGRDALVAMRGPFPPRRVR